MRGKKSVEIYLIKILFTEQTDRLRRRIGRFSPHESRRIGVNRKITILVIILKYRKSLVPSSVCFFLLDFAQPHCDFTPVARVRDTERDAAHAPYYAIIILRHCDPIIYFCFFRIFTRRVVYE